MSEPPRLLFSPVFSPRLVVIAQQRRLRAAPHQLLAAGSGVRDHRPPRRARRGARGQRAHPLPQQLPRYPRRPSRSISTSTRSVPGSRWADVDSVEGRRRFNDLKDPDYGFNHVRAVRIMGEPVEPIYPFAPDSTVVRFRLPALAPGDTMTVEMAWDARPSTVPRRQARRGTAVRLRAVVSQGGGVRPVRVERASALSRGRVLRRVRQLHRRSRRARGPGGRRHGRPGVRRSGLGACQPRAVTAGRIPPRRLRRLDAGGRRLRRRRPGRKRIRWYAERCTTSRCR